MDRRRRKLTSKVWAFWRKNHLLLNGDLIPGEYKTILQLVGVLSHGKIAKQLTDRAIDLMQDVQNLRKAIYEYDFRVLITSTGTDATT